MSWSGVLKFFLGLILAFAILAGGGFLAAQYMISRMATLPPRPTFPNDSPAKGKSGTAKPKAKLANADQDLPEAAASPAASPKPLPAGAYQGVVTQPIGLVLRDSPGRDARSIGGLANNEKVIVLETSADGAWQRIRTDLSDQEGWVRGGNIDKVAQ
jgi:Bacterial SH3 domain